MADNVPITAGTGTNVATDDVAGVHFQKIKLDGGGDGATTPIVAGAQTLANSVPVNDTPNATIKSEAITVATTAGLYLDVFGGTAPTAIANRRMITIQNRGTASIYIGASGVTTANGFEIPEGASFTFALGPGVAIYAIADTTSQNTRALQLA